MKKMRQAVRGWRLNRQTHVDLAALAQLCNPIIQGWWNYYGAFYPSAMLDVYRHIDRALERWARRKYKVLSGRQRASAQWLRKLKNAEPRLFYHWSVIGDCGGQWFLSKGASRWELVKQSPTEFASRVTMPQDIAWRIFTRGINRESARAQTKIVGDHHLGERVFDLTAIVA